MSSIFNNPNTKQEIDNFKERFLICEVVYKIILKEYTYRKTGIRLDRLKVNMKQAPSALKFVGYDFDKDLLAKLFGSDGQVGKRSVKKLRDALLIKLVKVQLLNFAYEKKSYTIT